MIELKNVSKYYTNNGVVTIGLKNINLNLDRNEIVAITGESGSGKSTLLNVICGVDSYEDGELVFNGSETSYFNQQDRDNYRKKHVSFIYQNYNIIESYSVLENVMVPLLINGVSPEEAKNKAKELIERVGLKHRMKNKGSKLSGGEKQRCVIARALATDADIIACDEPTGNLDSKTGEDIIKLIKEVANDKLVLIVTHNYEQVENIVTRTLRVHDGEIVEDVKKVEPAQVEEKKADFSNIKVKRSTLARFSFLNLVSTPKKNIFIEFVFICLSLAGLFLYLFCMRASYRVNSSSDDYKNLAENRFIVYKNDHSSFDKSSLEKLGNAYENAFYEDDEFNCYYSKTSNSSELTSDYFYGYFTKEMPSGVVVSKGVSKLNDNECFIVFPNASYKSYVRQKAFDEGMDGLLKGDLFKDLTVKGVGYSKSISCPVFVFKGDQYTIFQSFYIKKINCTYVVDGDEETINLMTVSEARKTYNDNTINVGDLLATGSVTSTKDLKFKLFDMYTLNLNITPSYKKITNSSAGRYYNYDLVLADDFRLTDTYEVNLYASRKTTCGSEINKLGLSYVQPARMNDSKQSITFIIFVFFAVLATIAMLIILFVSYVILSRIFIARKTDYAILRSLGVAKKDMSKIVLYEVLVESLIASTVSVVILYILSIFVPEINDLVDYNSWYFMIIYYAIMLLLAFRIAMQFNRKLFKFTLVTTMKGDVVSND